MSGGNIFISYRRGLDQDSAGRLFEAIEDRIGHERIFMDVDGIPPGVDFVEHLTSKLEDCDAFLAVIGPGWIERMGELHEEGDFVRKEFETVLGFSDKPFVPILFHDVQMPMEDQLPESLHALARKNAVTMPHEHFSSVMAGKIFPMLSEALGEDITKSEREKSKWQKLPKKLRRSVVGIGSLVGAGAVAAAVATVTTGPGWYYNLRAIPDRGEIGKSLMSFTEDEANFSRIDFSKSGTEIASGDGDLAAKIWDIKSGKLVQSFKGHSGRIEAVNFSEDEKWLATASQDNSARIWDINSGKEVQRLKGHTGFVYSIEFSPDGSKVVTGSADGTARIWDLETGEELVVLTGHTDEVEMAKFSPDGSIIATGSLDRSVRAWDANTGDLIQIVGQHNDAVNNLDFSPNGEALASVSEDGAIYLWFTEGWQEDGEFGNIQKLVSDVEFSPDGSMLLTSSVDGTMRIWDYKTGDEIGKLLDYGTQFYAATFSDDGSKIAGASHTKVIVRELAPRYD